MYINYLFTYSDLTNHLQTNKGSILLLLSLPFSSLPPQCHAWEGPHGMPSGLPRWLVVGKEEKEGRGEELES